jgi:hypothetical protein
MKRTAALPLLLLAMSLPLFAQNPNPTPQPWVCDNTTSLDDQGNPCLNFTTTGHPYQQSTTSVMPWDTDDGQPIPSGEYGAITSSYGSLFTVNIANDPLITVFGLVPNYGDPSGYFQAIASSSSSTPTPDGGFDVSYTIKATTQENAADFNNYPICYQGQCLAFVWQGTFKVHMYVQGHVSCGGRAHRICTIYGTGPGSGELSAVPFYYSL